MSAGASQPPSRRVFKMSAGGNDFVVVPVETDDGGWTPELVRRACARRLSLGADGLVLLAPSARATARFRLWNGDGSAAAFSGNGARCAARVLALLGRDREGLVSLETDGGLLEARVHDEAGGCRVEVEVAPPEDLRPGLPLPDGSPAPDGDHAVLGVPCLAVPVDDPGALDLESVAPPLRHLPDLPRGANVSFYARPAPPPGGHGPPESTGDRWLTTRPVPMRTWERGVEGETLSSGTGCAVVALSLALRAGALRSDGVLRARLLPRSGIAASVALHVEGGGVRSIRLEGDARVIVAGELGRDALSGFDPPGGSS